jgi:hypothetical protein
MEHYEPTTYSNLNTYSLNDDFLKLVINTLAGIQESKSTSEQAFHVVELRRIRKFDLNFFENIFNNIASHFERYIRHEDPTVAVESLTLCCEIFSYYKFEGPLREWMCYLIPAVIDQTTNKTQHKVKLTAVAAIANLSENMFYPETVETLLDIILESENEEAAVNAKQAFVGMVLFIDEVNLVNEFNWTGLLSNIDEFARNGSSSNLKRLNYIAEVLICVQTKLAKKFDHFLITCAEYADLCLNIMNSSY